jgi:phosphoribosylanthranilate isomerase
MRTRIKICGLTREADVATAVRRRRCVGFVCYANSPRYVAPTAAQRSHANSARSPFPCCCSSMPRTDLVKAARDAVPTAVLQFHGDEQEADCARYGRRTCAPCTWPRGSIC